MTSSAAAPTHTVGPYRLRAQVGQGGMGVVYLADAPDGGWVAVKVLRPHVVGDAHGRARLAREVTSLRRVRSPRIAEVYDADPWGETPYVVTRYVAGNSLREAVDRHGPLTGRELDRVARGLAEALVVVHAADVLHRDVKPSNVLLEAGEPVLIDFGLAQLSDDLTLTQEGWLLGTPGYLAPEILSGDGPSPAADVHSWAATVTFAALGRGPYGSGPAIAVMDRARRGEFDLRGVPPDLAPLLTAALRPDPANRPTARQVVEWLGATDPAPRPAPAPAPAPRVAPRSRAAAPAGGASAAPAGNAFAPATGRLRHFACWVAVACLVVAGVVAAPAIALAATLVVSWALRVLTLATVTVRGWEQARGPRRRDILLCWLALPWFAVRRIAATLLNGLCVLGGTVGFVALGRFGPAGAELPALLVAGIVTAAMSWWGPFSRDVRRGATAVTARLPRSALALAIVVVLLLGLASGLLAGQQVVGTTYAPFGGR